MMWARELKWGWGGVGCCSEGLGWGRMRDGLLTSAGMWAGLGCMDMGRDGVWTSVGMWDAVGWGVWARGV